MQQTALVNSSKFDKTDQWQVEKSLNRILRSWDEKDGVLIERHLFSSSDKPDIIQRFLYNSEGLLSREEHFDR